MTGYTKGFCVLALYVRVRRVHVQTGATQRRAAS